MIKASFFLELMTSLGFSVLDGGDFNIDKIKITQWQKDILHECIKNASADYSKNWDDVKDNFSFDS